MNRQIFQAMFKEKIMPFQIFRFKQFYESLELLLEPLNMDLHPCNALFSIEVLWNFGP